MAQTENTASRNNICDTDFGFLRILYRLLQKLLFATFDNNESRIFLSSPNVEAVSSFWGVRSVRIPLDIHSWRQFREQTVEPIVLFRPEIPRRCEH